MSKKLLSTSSLLTVGHVYQPPSTETFFPEYAIFMRPLRKDDEQAVALFLEKEGFEPEDGDPKYGIFDHSHKLIYAYDDYRNAVHNSKINNWLLMWMH